MRRHDIAMRADVGAQVGDQADIESCRMPIGVAAAVTSKVAFARVVDCRKMLKTILDPADGPPQPQRQPWDEEIFRIEFAAHAETAADVGLDEADAAVRHSKHRASSARLVCGTLVGPKTSSMPPRPVVIRQQAAGFERHAGMALD